MELLGMCVAALGGGEALMTLCLPALPGPASPGQPGPEDADLGAASDCLVRCAIACASSGPRYVSPLGICCSSPVREVPVIIKS